MAIETTRWGILYCPKSGIGNARKRWDRIDEVRALLDEGIAADDLMYYGLEYKFVTEYITGLVSYDEMFSRLETAIHQFAKRQMTWFRGMERRGFTINWIDATLPMDEKVERILEIQQSHGKSMATH